MNPIRYAGVLAFFEWLQTHHPDVKRVRDLSEVDFLALAKSYEASHGLMIGPSHKVYMKWQSTLKYIYLFKNASSDAEALEDLHHVA
jgi:hypothetical protein